MTARVLGLKRRRPPAQVPVDAQPGVRLGTMVALEEPDGVWVQSEPGGGRVFARLGIDCDARRLAHAVEQRQLAVLAFEAGDPARPIVLGIMGSGPTAPWASTAAPTTEPFAIAADADGRRVHLQAQEVIVLQCGRASITLKRNGSIVIRGNYIETYASGTNRIKGGNVRVN